MFAKDTMTKLNLWNQPLEGTTGKNTNVNFNVNLKSYM